MVCMAWTITDEESHDREQAEEWLKREDPGAFILREEVMREHGRPATAVRIESILDCLHKYLLHFNS